MSKRLRSSEVCADCSGPGESHRRGPLLSALLTGTLAPGPPPRVRRLRAVEPRIPCRGSRVGGTGVALGREPSRACQSRAGRGPPPSRPFRPSRPSRPSCPRPCGEGRARGRGSFFNRKGLGQSTGKPITEVKTRTSSELRPPEAAGVTSSSPCAPCHPAPLRSARAPWPEWATFAASLHRDWPADP